MAVVALGSAGEFVGRSNRVSFTGVLDMRRVVGMGRVFGHAFLVMMFIMSVFNMDVFSGRLGGGRLDRRHGGHAGFRFRNRCFACGVCPCVRTLRIVIVVVVRFVIVVIVRLVVLVTMRLVIMRIMVVMRRILMMPNIILMMLSVVRMHFAGIRTFVLIRFAFIGLGGL